MTPREHTEQMLQSRHVSPEIIERVLRLSAPYREGELLRGFHYKRTIHEERLFRDCTTKGWVIRKHGRDVWNRIRPSGIFKRGRREYVARQALQLALPQ